MFKVSVNAFLFLAVSGFASAQAECFTSTSQLQTNKIKTKWVETSMDDGLPLTISVSNAGGGLVYTAKKNGAIWLKGNVQVCKDGSNVKMTLHRNTVTDNVPMLARGAMKGDKSFDINGNQIKIGGMGWGGVFVGQ